MQKSKRVSLALKILSLVLASIPTGGLYWYSHADNPYITIACILIFFAIVWKFFTSVPPGFEAELIFFGRPTGIFFGPGYYLTPNLDFGMMANNLRVAFGFKLNRLFRTEGIEKNLQVIDIDEYRY